ncbi:hypothetical protein KBY96_04980 [Cyanobium sp. ATX 6A2]|uniref:hypothetical protein n=1 Tax=Cyanobium sp. ATX 6A2 TaxID=2823700 RepID=UPI0020CBC2A3|nr:hypothetical protein [Cyanobium sp. ATX 6A2]MCP9887289.1 hypothetical protein [Cyanobium sp. ATX 6A2]
MACPHCGSGSVKADRSLAGRLVCGRCGKPLGPGAARRARASGPTGFQSRSGRRSPWPWLAALLALSAGLAWLAESSPQRPRRSPAPAPARMSQPWQ